MLQLLLAIIYLSFISLGLPDSLLGSAWPSMYREFSVPVSYAGIISMIIAAGTIVSSLYSDRLTGRFGTGRVTAASVGLTCLALFGFSFSHTFGLLVLWAVPYGLGAGAVDASLNNYVALHYKSRHMSWLHCMWGIGASLGPSIMGYAIAKGQTWNTGYRWIGYIQLVLTAVLLLSLPLWHEKAEDAGKTEMAEKAFSLREILRIPGAEAVMITFFCYCALEQTAGLWASSYLALHWNVPAETAASFASMFYIGITIGRAVSGFLTFRLNDTALIRLGQGVIAIGGLMLAVPVSSKLACMGLIVIGLGCAPVYPSLLHSTPAHFGTERSQAVVGVQMASAYIGSCLMPPLFGFLARHVAIALFPFYLLAVLLLMVFMHERVIFQTSESR